ncbi:hypothetical protein MNAN1_001947 [Malassezia nana]|uniref:Uncharacterized protein n=1 Tax=Malassezia nana TaxID=180528 RepID=A0AAF0EM92_9BASI|nr:hypothetical protein MNAN1_001947 [Malassezia nana]
MQHSFMDAETYCLRVCKDSDMAWNYCKNIYDELGCNFNMPTGPDDGNDFESCEGDDAQIVGVYTSNGQVSTFFQSQTKQGQPVPPPKPPPAVSQCTPFASSKLEGTLKNPFAHAGEASMASSYSSSSSMSLSSSSSSSFNSTSVALQPISSSSSTYSNFTSTSSSTSSTATPSPTSTRSMVTVTASSSNTPISGLEFGRNGAQSLSTPTYIYVGIFLLAIVVLGSGDGSML